MKRSFVKVIAASLACTMLLSACGGSSAGTSDTTGTVSYTHLDVYKRQSIHRMIITA